MGFQPAARDPIGGISPAPLALLSGERLDETAKWRYDLPARDVYAACRYWERRFHHLRSRRLRLLLSRRYGRLRNEARSNAEAWRLRWSDLLMTQDGRGRA